MGLGSTLELLLAKWASFTRYTSFNNIICWVMVIKACIRYSLSVFTLVFSVRWWVCILHCSLAGMWRAEWHSQQGAAYTGHWFPESEHEEHNSSQGTLYPRSPCSPLHWEPTHTHQVWLLMVCPVLPSHFDNKHHVNVAIVIWWELYFEYMLL